MRYILVLSTALFLLDGLAFGQDEPSLSAERLTFLQPYVGTWTRTGPLEEDLPHGKEGEVGTSSITWRWAYNKNVVDWKWEFDFAGKRSGTKGTLTWDPVQNKLVGAGVFSDGGVIRVTGRSTDPLIAYAEFVEPDGTVRSHVETFTLNDDGTMSIRLTERKNEPVTEDSPEYVFTRVSPSLPAESSIPKKAIKELRFMIGEWESEISVNGKPEGTATHQRMWAPGRHCLRMTWQGESDGVAVHAFGISGWDAEKKAVVENWHDVLGNHLTVTYPLEKMGKEAWEGTARRVYPDGSVTEGACKLEKGDGRWTFTVGEPENVRNETRKIK